MASKRRPFSQVLLGRPLETSEASHQAIGKLPGLAVFASDALSSVAYATEEILVVLALAGVAYFGVSIPIAIAISLLLILLAVSYRQTIFAYPNGGGAYIVARENLGELAAQVAGAALMMDYVLTVSVSISSGVAQIVSAFPFLGNFRVELGVSLIVIMAVVNLRGTRESSMILSIPTYFFLLMMFLMLAVGFWRWAAGSLSVVDGVEMIRVGVQPLSLFLILRAFSSGSTAMTGIEAISNGITAFKEPRQRNAATTLMAMSIVLLGLFLGITLLAHQIGSVPSHSETVISQIARTVFGDGLIYLLVLASTTGILIMAANTSFADFPRLAALLAGDGFLPRQLTIRGSRLVFSWGITGLTIIAALLVVVFRASVSLLIPLYAVGVFLSFTLSQTGMVIRWRRISQLRRRRKKVSSDTTLVYDAHWHWKQVLNGIGAILTAIVTAVFLATKFRDGAWVIALLIPSLTWVFFRIHRHYREVAQRLSIAGAKKVIGSRSVKTILLVDRLHASTIQNINFALSLGMPWVAVHVSIDKTRTEQLKHRWNERFPEERLVILDSPYRSLTEPFLDYVRKVRREDPGAFIHVVLGELVTETYWEQALHDNSALVLELALRQIDGVAVTVVPFQLRQLPSGKQPIEVPEELLSSDQEIAQQGLDDDSRKVSENVQGLLH
jgi:amino acid transporter